MSQMVSQQAQNMSHLPRKERLKLRNEIIIMQVSSGTDKEDIAKQFTISLRQVHRIIKEIEEENQEWYQNLPKKGMAAMFRYNSMNVFSEITTLKKLRNDTKEPEKKFDMTQGIINSIINYNRMIAEGPVLTKQKELTEQAEQVINNTLQT